MTAQILAFGKVERPKTNKIVLSGESLYNNVIDEVLYEWHNAAKSNALNAFIHRKIPPVARGSLSNQIDYLSDLTSLAFIEDRLGMRKAMYFPHTPQNDSKYIVIGFYDDKHFLSPSPIVQIDNEAYARALNIVLFVYYTKAKLTNKI